MENLYEILCAMGMMENPLSIAAFSHEDGEGEYAVWRVEYADCCYVLKRANPAEAECYTRYLQNAAFAPRLIAKVNDYLLLEYIEGSNLMRCNRTALIAALDSMIEMQNDYWDTPKAQAKLESRKNRRQYLSNDLLEQAYDAYLRDCEQVSWTLCHDDLLPFNVIHAKDRAVFVDWEHAGILPYPASLARLIAHTEDKDDALFYMTAADVEFAINYYYQKLLKTRGIPYESYRRSLDLHLFYEYCEWVYVGNKFGDTTGELYKKYSVLTINMAKKLGF